MSEQAVREPAVRERAVRERGRRAGRRALPYLLALAVALVGILALVPRPQRETLRATATHVVLAGAPGLRWDDVSPVDTPTLWALAERGSVGALAVRSARNPTCPADGWLTLGAGNYARGPDEPVNGRCPLTYPTVEPTEVGAKLRAEEHDAIVDDNRSLAPSVEVGALSESARCTAAVGPGAALAAARPFGRVDRYAERIDGNLPALLDSCRLSFVDLGTVDGDGVDRVVSARRADAALAAVLAARPARSLVLVAGLSDTDAAARLHVAIAQGPGFGPGWLTSPSTGRDGYVRLIDLAPTALAAVGRPAPTKLFAGAAAERGAGRPRNLPAAVGRLADADRLAGAQRRVSTWFFTLLAVGQLALYLALVPHLRRARHSVPPPGGPGRFRWAAGWGPGPVSWIFAGLRRARTTPGGVAVRSGYNTGIRTERRLAGSPPGSRLAPTRSRSQALVAAALATPVAMVTDVVPWWRAARPGLLFGLIFVAGLAAATAVAWRLTRRYGALGPLGGVAAAVAVAVGVDVLTGSRLQLDGVAGYSALAGGRYSGIGTIGLGMFAGGLLLAAACLAQRAARRWRPVIVATAGSLGVVIVGSPYFGADAGGAVGLTAGVFAAAAMSAGGWLSYRRLAWAVTAGAALTATFALLDLRRPAEHRSSVGRFLAHVGDGTASEVINRAGASSVVTFLTSPLTLLVVGAGAYTGLVLLRPWGGLRRVYGLFPAVRGALAGVVVATVLAGVFDGVGLNVTGAALAVALPLTVLAVLRVQHHADVRTQPLPPAPTQVAGAGRVARPPAGRVLL